MSRVCITMIKVLLYLLYSSDKCTIHRCLAVDVCDRLLGAKCAQVYEDACNMLIHV